MSQCDCVHVLNRWHALETRLCILPQRSSWYQQETAGHIPSRRLILEKVVARVPPVGVQERQLARRKRGLNCIGVSYT